MVVQFDHKFLIEYGKIFQLRSLSIASGADVWLPQARIPLLYLSSFPNTGAVHESTIEYTFPIVSLYGKAKTEAVFILSYFSYVGYITTNTSVWKSSGVLLSYSVMG